MNKYEQCLKALILEPKVWLITGVAGFIGSNLLEKLLGCNQKVIGLDNFETGYHNNLDEVRDAVTPSQWASFTFIEGDICDLPTCLRACSGTDFVLHQAALGSVPRSVKNPLATNATNIDGFLNMLWAAKDCDVKSFVYAASSSTYGDNPSLPKVESVIGEPLSPYAVTKLVNELYATVFAKTYGFDSIGLRYFNVFGKRQSPTGAYAAVIPKWISSMLSGEGITINGSGETSRDFCFVDNAVQANILAATADTTAQNQVYNVAVGGRTSLNALHLLLASELKRNGKEVNSSVEYLPFRKGDVLHSQADISKASQNLGYAPLYDVTKGITEAMSWYIDKNKNTTIAD